MSDALKRYIVTYIYHDSGLSDVQKLNSAMVAAGFTTTLTDNDGKLHELGTNSFGVISPLSINELEQACASAGESVLGQKPEVKVTTLEAFLRDAAQ